MLLLVNVVRMYDVQQATLIIHMLVYLRVNLYDFADILISKGVVNAINLDGGGSATFLVDGVLTNHPSDHW